MKYLPLPGLERNEPRQGWYALRHVVLNAFERNGASRPQHENGDPADFCVHELCLSLLCSG